MKVQSLVLLGSILFIKLMAAVEDDRGHSALEQPQTTQMPIIPQNMLLEPTYPDSPLGVDVTVDALFWQQMSADFQFATKGATVIIDRGAFAGVTQQPVFGIDWGFRVALGYQLMDDLWRIEANYTWMHFNGNMKVSAYANETITDLLNITSHYLHPTRIDHHTTLHYSNLDIVLKRAYKFAEYVSIEPLFGIEVEWLRVKQVNKDSGGNLFALYGASDYKVDLMQKQATIGPIAGLHTLWDVGFNCFLSGNIDFALTTGRNHSTEVESNTINPIIANAISIVHRNQLHMQTFLGVIYNQTIQDSITFGGKVGWELLLLKNALLYGPSAADLAAQGGTMGLWILF